MSRERKFGPAVSLRLPLEHHHAMIEAATKADMPVSVWLRHVVVDRLATPRARVKADLPDVAKRAAGEAAQERADTIAEQKHCPHATTTFNGTVRICSACGKVIR